MLPGVTITDPWLSCITMGTAWQYQPTNDRYKSGTNLINLLIEARSKGGSLLLNIGPKADGAVATEQEDRLREMAGWYFINKEAVDSVKPWVITNEHDTWYTTSTDKKTVYAFITNAAGWKEGERKSFLFRSVKGTGNTKINVLGQSSILQEYNPGKDVSCKWKITDSGLNVSVVKAQRIADDHHWPNPVVIKIENVLPAIEPVQIVTGAVTATSKITAKLTGNLYNYKNAKGLAVKFYYHRYNGQIEDLYAGAWMKSTPVKLTADGSFSMQLTGLEKGLQYQFKAVVINNGIEIDGDKKVWRQPL